MYHHFIISMKFYIYLLLIVCVARCEIQLRGSITAEDLHGNTHMNNMIANTLNNKRFYFSGLMAGAPENELTLSFDYNVVESARTSLTTSLDYLTIELGQQFGLVKEELITAADNGESGVWHIYIFLKVEESECRPVVVFIRWDIEKSKFDVHMLGSRKVFPVSFKTSHLVRYTSLFGTEAGEATLIAEEITSDESAIYHTSKVVLLAAMNELAYKRGVDPKNPAAEIHFKNFMSKKFGLGLNPVLVTMAAAAVVKLAAQVYQVFAQVFATKDVTKLIGEFKTKGFSAYSLKASVRRYIDIPSSNIDQFTTVIAKIMTNDHPDKAKQRRIKAVLEVIPIIDDNGWTMDDISLDTGKPDSSDKFFTVMSSQENFGAKFNFMAMNVESTFTLTPNLLIYKRSRSVFGGIFKSEEIKIQESPRTVTDKDLQAMRAFNLVMSCKLFSDDLGGQKLSWPAMPK